MYSSHSYPIFLSLAHRHCLIAGLGPVGQRKLAGLLGNNVGSVLVRELRPYEELEPQARDLLRDPRVSFGPGSCGASDIKASFMVFACAAAAENRRIAQLCQEFGILCDSATEPENGSFILPATARRGFLCAAISTGGQSPHLARIWRRELEDWLEPRQRLAWLMGRLRPLILDLGLPQPENARLMALIAASPLPRWLNSPGDIDKCHEWLKTRLPASAANRLARIFSEYAHAFA